MNSAITSSSGFTTSWDHHVHTPMSTPPNVQTASGNHGVGRSPVAPFHKRAVSQVERFMTQNTAKPMTKPAAIASSTMPIVTVAVSTRPSD